MQVKTAVYVQRAAQELKTQKWRINEEQKNKNYTHSCKNGELLCRLMLYVLYSGNNKSIIMHLIIINSFLTRDLSFSHLCLI